jgi:hypothetical protein
MYSYKQEGAGEREVYNDLCEMGRAGCGAGSGRGREGRKEKEWRWTLELYTDGKEVGEEEG